MKVLDLFSGLGGFSQAFSERGHDVVTIDIDRSFRPTIQADLMKPPIKKGAGFDVVLASPPCEEFSRDYMPWLSGDPEKGMVLVHAAKRIIDEIDPEFWVIENVRGAVKYFKPLLGNYRQRCGSRYLWGKFPFFPCEHKKCYGKEKLPPSEMRKALRGVIPYEISLNLCMVIENERGWY